ncbi:ABC transporter substrate-binding protein [Lipingzhangella rawalii]
MLNRSSTMAALGAVVLVVTACSTDNGAGGSYPRDETLYTTGTQWGPPSNWNPIMNWTYATGTVGYAYETLFLYDPQEEGEIPWLAESGAWTDEDTYVVTLRDGITWEDDEPLTADDVVFTVELGQIDSVPYSNLWNWLDGVEARDETTVEFTFTEPRHQEWENWLYSNAIVPEHIWSELGEDEIVSDPNEDPVGTGPYTYADHTDERMIWAKKDDWWATEHLDLEVAPNYIVDVVTTSNENALTMLDQNEIDMSTNFLPGIDQTLDTDEHITSYYDGPPYMIPANTAWLNMNTEREPLDDADFRRAMAHAIDVEQIVAGPYSDLVEAADPTGLLPVWENYIDEDLVAEQGFSYDRDEAEALLEEAGYTDTTGDGYVETPDGDPIALDLAVPSGWTDWMEASRIISENLQEVGIDATSDTPDEAALQDARETGDFDLIINNERQISNTPWTYFDYLFRLPVEERQTTVNFGRYENEEAWELTEEFSRIPVDDRERMQEAAAELQEIHLSELPAIPLWYNGLWSQVNEGTWTNWPSADEDTPHYFPTTFRGYHQMGAILTLTEIEPAD